MQERIVNQTIEKDIIHFFNIADKMKLVNFLRELAYLSGKLLRISSLSIDYQTAFRYLSILEDPYIIRLLHPYFKNTLKEIKKTKKLYFYDLGFRNVLSQLEKGFITENCFSSSSSRKILED